MRVETDKVLEYGPERPKEDHSYEKFSTPHYLTGHARKICHDLIRVARLYNGRLVRLYKPSDDARCPKCTDAITGQVLLGSCPVCHGTGRINSWVLIGDFWSLTDFGQKYRMATDMGATENPGVREQIIILGAPLLRDQHLIIFVEMREIYKIYDAEPHIVAMRGEVVTQIASASRLSPGYPEYELIDW